jgi:hypothetical protein
MVTSTSGMACLEYALLINWGHLSDLIGYSCLTASSSCSLDRFFWAKANKQFLQPVAANLTYDEENLLKEAQKLWKCHLPEEMTAIMGHEKWAISINFRKVILKHFLKDNLRGN